MYSSVRNISIVAHALTCLPNAGAFGPSVPQPPNLTSLWKLQYSVDIVYSKRTLLKGGGSPVNPLVPQSPNIVSSQMKILIGTIYFKKVAIELYYIGVSIKSLG